MKLQKFVRMAMVFLAIGIMLNNRGIGRIFPKYNGVDPNIAPYVDDWLDLAKFYGIRFNNKVSIGFNDINQGSIIGLTHYETYFREIDIDRSYWDRSTGLSKRALIYHELGHAYCYRSHDYGDGKEYLPHGGSRKDPNQKDGFFSDGCPKSLMFPTNILDVCVLSHYDGYMKEIFERCEPF